MLYEISDTCIYFLLSIIYNERYTFEYFLVYVFFPSYPMF